MGEQLQKWIDANSATLQALAGPGQGIPPSAMPGAAPPQAPAFPPGDSVRGVEGPFPPEAFAAQPATAGGFPAPQAPQGSVRGAEGPFPPEAFGPAADPQAPQASVRGVEGPFPPEAFGAPQAAPVDVAGPQPGQAPPAAAPKPKPKDGAMGFDQVMKDADPKQIDDAIKVMEEASGKSIEELYTEQSGAPPPKGMGKRKLGQALFEFGLNLMAAPAGLSDVETIGRAGQATIAGRRQREEKEEAKQVAADERRALAEERRMGRMDKQFDRSAVLKRLEIEQQRLQHLLDKPIGPFKDYIGEDGYLYSRDQATNEARQVLHKGKPFKPNEAFMKSAEKRLEWEIKYNGYLSVHGSDSQGRPITGAAMRKIQDDALGYANSTRQMDETQARMKAHDKAAELLKEDDDYFDATPEEKRRMLDQRTRDIADFYMLRTDTMTGNKPDPSKLTEGVATPLKDPDTGVMEYWTLDAEGKAKQVQPGQILQQ